MVYSACVFVCVCVRVRTCGGAWARALNQLRCGHVVKIGHMSRSQWVQYIGTLDPIQVHGAFALDFGECYIIKSNTNTQESEML